MTDDLLRHLCRVENRAETALAIAAEMQSQLNDVIRDNRYLENRLDAECAKVADLSRMIVMLLDRRG